MTEIQTKNPGDYNEDRTPVVSEVINLVEKKIREGERVDAVSWQRETWNAELEAEMDEELIGMRELGYSLADHIIRNNGTSPEDTQVLQNHTGIEFMILTEEAEIGCHVIHTLLIIHMEDGKRATSVQKITEDEMTLDGYMFYLGAGGGTAAFHEFSIKPDTTFLERIVDKISGLELLEIQKLIQGDATESEANEILLPIKQKLAESLDGLEIYEITSEILNRHHKAAELLQTRRTAGNMTAQEVAEFRDSLKK